MFLFFLEFLCELRGKLRFAFLHGNDAGENHFPEHFPPQLGGSNKVLERALRHWKTGSRSWPVTPHPGPQAIACGCFGFLICKIENNATCLTDCFEITWGNKPHFLNSKTLSILTHTEFPGGKKPLHGLWGSQVLGNQNVKKKLYSFWGSTINKSALPVGGIVGKRLVVHALSGVEKLPRVRFPSFSPLLRGLSGAAQSDAKPRAGQLGHFVVGFSCGNSNLQNIRKYFWNLLEPSGHSPSVSFFCTWPRASHPSPCHCTASKC